MRVFSGIQPTGRLHLGNYFGAVQNMVKLQEGNETLFSIVDLHALTVTYDPKSFQERLFNTAVDFFACGIDPRKSIVFIQSHIKEHAELCWILNNVTPVGQLQRMTQFKDKAQKEKSVNAGLLIYPVLQAADILLYDTDLVPIGEDQKQHLELTQDIARRFNQRFGKVFKIPKIQLPERGARIMSLTDPARKMSKSEPEGCLFLADEPGVIYEKIKKAVTDSGSEIKASPEKPALSNLLIIYSLFTKKEIGEIEKDFQGKGYAEFKEQLAKIVSEGLADFRQRRKQLLDSPQTVKKILEEGAKKASALARVKMAEIKKAMGLS